VDILQGFVDLLTTHAFAVIFIASLIEATGIPCPSRILLLLASAVAAGPEALMLVALAATAGSLIGDHIPYTLGLLTGPRLLTLYCRVTLGSQRCVENTTAYFTRFGAPAILLSRFSTGVRLFASVLSGCGHIGYGRFLAYDTLGTIGYVALWTTVGHFVGTQALELLRHYAGLRALVLVIPVTFVAIVAYRLWRRARYGVPDVDRSAVYAATVAACEAQSPGRAA
jgi:membrane protein DedA with SNARE-associated domain